MTEITVQLEACEPTELMRNAFEYKVWIRFIEASFHWPGIEVRGETEEVYNFIAMHWDKELAEAVVYETGPYAKEVKV